MAAVAVVRQEEAVALQWAEVEWHQEAAQLVEEALVVSLQHLLQGA